MTQDIDGFFILSPHLVLPVLLEVDLLPRVLERRQRHPRRLQGQRRQYRLPGLARLVAIKAKFGGGGGGLWPPVTSVCPYVRLFFLCCCGRRGGRKKRPLIGGEEGKALNRSPFFLFPLWRSQRERQHRPDDPALFRTASERDRGRCCCWSLTAAAAAVEAAGVATRSGSAAATVAAGKQHRKEGCVFFSSTLRFKCFLYARDLRYRFRIWCYRVSEGCQHQQRKKVKK